MTQIVIDEAAIRTQAQRDGVTHFATGVAAFRGGKLLVVRRAPHDFLGGVWELPGGGVDAGETFETGAIRELGEETGLIFEQIVAQFAGFDYSTDKKLKVRQINLVITVQPGEILLEPTEHDGFRWIDEGDVDSIVETTSIMQQCFHDAFHAYAANY